MSDNLRAIDETAPPDGGWSPDARKEADDLVMAAEEAERIGAVAAASLAAQMEREGFSSSDIADEMANAARKAEIRYMEPQGYKVLGDVACVSTVQHQRDAEVHPLYPLATSQLQAA